VLRRRQCRVVVRAPEASPGSYPRVNHERRARVSTLVGLGAREAMPTLFDIADENEVTHPGLQLLNDERGAEEQLSLVPWDDDEEEDTSCFDL